MRQSIVVAAFLAATASLAVATAASGEPQEHGRVHDHDHGMPNAMGPRCDRACLTGVLEQYLAGLTNHDPARVPFAEVVHFTEDNVPLKIGDGLWGSISGIDRHADVTVADPEAGQVGYYGVVKEHDQPAYLALRLKVRSGRITEVESVVHRMNESGPGANPLTYRPDAAFSETLPPEQRVPRARLVDIANGYFSTLQLNDGQIFTQFDPNCARWENGQQSAGDPNAKNPQGRLGCGEIFKLGNYRWDTRVRDRGYLVVDEERGLVMARAFIDHAGVLSDYTLTNGEHRVSPIKAPHTWCMLELFKIRSGQIYRIQVVFVAVPYYMRSPWMQER